VSIGGASTRLLALLGHPVDHSASPALHRAACAAAGVDATYLAFDVPPERLAAAVEGLRALGALGANVTVPHKQAVLELVDACTDEAQAVGAGNTLFWDGGRLVADNTDATGLHEVLADDLALAAGVPVQLVGAGGAARAAAVALGRLGARVRVWARRREQAEQVTDLALAHGASPLGDREPVTVVLNATPLGLADEPLPDPFMTLADDQIALDLVYRPEPTPFLRAAMAAGARAVDGRGMLLAQAAHAFVRWTGQPAPRAALGEALAQAMGASHRR